jgi:aminoglycoside 3-N-acetyltransferase
VACPPAPGSIDAYTAVVAFGCFRRVTTSTHRATPRYPNISVAVGGHLPSTIVEWPTTHPLAQINATVKRGVWHGVTEPDRVQQSRPAGRPGDTPRDEPGLNLFHNEVERSMHSRKQLADDFRRLGVSAGDTVMLHASARAVGPVAGGPDQIHLALKDALTAEGTLMMYAGCPRYFDEVGRGNLTKEQEREVFEKLPAFDPLTARSARDHGVLVEFFRTYPGSRVNPHVARFVVWGKKADDLISHQPWDYAFGFHSPLDRFLGADGRILLLGSDHDAVTFLHYVEHVAEFSGKRVVCFHVPVEEDGRRVWRAMEEFDTADGSHANWPEDFFAKIIDSFLSDTANQGGQVGDAMSYILSLWPVRICFTPYGRGSNRRPNRRRLQTVAPKAVTPGLPPLVTT